MSQELKPCPFCGAGETRIHVNKGTWTGQGYGEPVSVEVRHWCDDVKGQPSRPILRIGRDEASAIAAWNKRTQPAGEAEPVAWIRMRTLDAENDYAEITVNQPPANETRWTALYAAPAPSASPAALTERTRDILIGTEAEKFFANADDKNMTARLQDLGYEFGCPPGIKIIDWLRVRLAAPPAAANQAGPSVTDGDRGAIKLAADACESYGLIAISERLRAMLAAAPDPAESHALGGSDE